MGSIYTNGSCNICVTSAFDSSDGLLPSQGKYPLPNVKLELGQENYLVTLPRIWTQGVEESPLLSRAWVVQERLLSRCNLHFTTTQIFWECSAGSACEQLDFLLSDVYLSASRKKDFTSSPALNPSLSIIDILSLWNDVVQAYSTRALTRATDRLIALSGIVSTFLERWSASGNQIEYLVGFWAYNIIPQLLWYRVVPGAQPSNYIAPGWSWAAVNDEVRDIFQQNTGFSTSAGFQTGDKSSGPLFRPTIRAKNRKKKKKKKKKGPGGS
jgi:hypothetical protein